MTLGRVVFAFVVAVTAIAAPACVTGRGGESTIAGRNVKSLSPTLLGPKVLGLDVQAEDTKDALESFRRTYVEALSLYTLRDGQQLEATFQVARFSPTAARVKDFRATVVAQIGGAIPQIIRYGRDVVYLTQATKQRVAVWFRGRYALILSTREEFDRPRSLLRSLLEVDPTKP